MSGKTTFLGKRNRKSKRESTTGKDKTPTRSPYFTEYEATEDTRNRSTRRSKRKYENNEKKVDPDAKRQGTDSGARLPNSFFNCPALALCKSLLGTLLVRVDKDTGLRLGGRIVETEAYPGGEDKASHSYGGRQTERNGAMFMAPGTGYVYFVYGMYNCFNISCQGEGSAVLIRALDPVSGLELMRSLRGERRADKGANLKLHEFCNGPSKLCQAMKITREQDKCVVTSADSELWLERDGESVDDADIICTTRIGIAGAGPEWAAKPWRFYIKGHKSVSVKDKKAEATAETTPSQL